MKKIVVLLLIYVSCVGHLSAQESPPPPQPEKAPEGICEQIIKSKPMQWALAVAPFLACAILWYKLDRANKKVTEQHTLIDQLNKNVAAPAAQKKVVVAEIPAQQLASQKTPEPAAQSESAQPTPSPTPPMPPSESNSVSSTKSRNIPRMDSVFSSLSQDVPQHKHSVKPESLDSVDTKKLGVILERGFNVAVTEDELHRKKQHFSDIILLIQDLHEKNETADEIADKLLNIMDSLDQEDLLKHHDESSVPDRQKAPLKALKNFFHAFL